MYDVECPKCQRPGCSLQPSADERFGFMLQALMRQFVRWKARCQHFVEDGWAVGRPILLLDVSSIASQNLYTLPRDLLFNVNILN